jgi:lipoprotein-anchoring transpeptidase ErfK/SrfK
MNFQARISRRNFLKTSLLGLGALAVSPDLHIQFSPTLSTLADFPSVPILGRVVGGKIEVKSQPSFDSDTTKILFDDGVVVWQREVIGAPNLNRGKNRKWVETPDGFIYGPDLQYCQNIVNEPLKALPQNASGAGMWAEVTVPYVDAPMANPPARAEVLKQLDRNPRLYYSQVYWIDDMRTRNNITEYHVTEKHGSPGDMFWADARALRPITAEELTPIHPDVTDKRVVVNVSNQTMACYEGKREVYYCRVSTGAKFNADGKSVDKWATPLGIYNSVSRKFVSLHMAGGTRASGYEVFGVGWTSFFATGGYSIHSTYWHSNYGEPMSHGCVNAMPEDAKFVFLWSAPQVPYDPGKLEISGYDGTKVEVIEA